MERRNSINLEALNTVWICIDSATSLGLWGRAYHRASAEPVLFRELGGAIIRLDTALDALGGPQSSTGNRRFGRADRSGKKKEVTPVDSNAIKTQKGDKATFVVQVQYRQHATWQGTVLWAEENETKPFRSALELIKLIDSALDDSGVKKED